jgi:hypothetical protein
MRKGLALLLFGLVLLGIAATDVFAQAAPTPQVTITGFIDTITSASRNLQTTNFVTDNDSEWYTRNRIRVDMIGALGSAKIVLGIEIDSAWGQVSGADNNLAAGGVNAQRTATTSGFDLNTDTQGSVEMKWAYVEFPIPGIPTVVRLGAQPFAATYKLAAYATGDFAGVNAVTTFTPDMKWHLTYVQVEEQVVGSNAFTGSQFTRGDDWAVITSFEWTPMKGLDLRPFYAYFNAIGSTNGNARNNNMSSSWSNNGVAASAGTLTYPTNGQENRHTVGIDARWRFGPFSLDPTLFYQFGSRDTVIPGGAPGAGGVSSADISAFYGDVTFGWRIGPVLLEMRGLYTTGNKAGDKLWEEVNYYQPLNTDTSYWAGGWGNIYALGIDYFNGAIRGMGPYIGLDRYGRAQVALRANYAWTPAFDTYLLVSPGWTAQSVDKNANPTTLYGVGAAPTMNCTGNCQGDSSYIGTEFNIGTTWRFAPGLTFDAVFGYMWAGDALGQNGQSPANIYTGVARVRYSW